MAFLSRLFDGTIRFKAVQLASIKSGIMATTAQALTGSTNFWFLPTSFPSFTAHQVFPIAQKSPFGQLLIFKQLFSYVVLNREGRKPLNVFL